jgi:tRNA (guanine37-N1)-methyltransferase
MTFDIVTIFPALVNSALGEGLLARAISAGLLVVRVHDLRRWSGNRWGKVDEAPFGGGGGMLLRPEPLFDAVDEIRALRGPQGESERLAVALLCPQGRRLDQEGVAGLKDSYDRMILLCGRYEGVDERVRERLADLEISIGDYVLSGGELPALVVVEAVTRLLPGALGCADSAGADSFSSGLLDFPQYTRPADYRGLKVPEVLLSGDHQAVAAWRREQSLARTRARRPDLIRTHDEPNMIRRGDR